MNERIVLTIPRDRPFHGVAHLVLGGLAARLQLTVDDLDDLQVALAELLDYAEIGSDVTVELAFSEDSIEAEVGPFELERLRTAMEPEQESYNLQRVLAAVVDEVELTRDDRWVRLTKAVEPAAEAV